MFELDDLRTFVAVADAGGLTPAARRLGLSKSIVSRRLVRLESALGSQLLARTTRGAALTEAGVIFRDHAVRIIEATDAAVEAVSPGDEVRGLLRITAPLSFGSTFLAPVLAELALRYPRLHVHTVYTDRFVDLVGEGFDAAIRLGLLKDSALIARRITAIHGKAVASPEYLQARGTPRTPSDLLVHEALMQGTEAWPFFDQGKPATVHPQGRFKADNGEALAAAAVAGVGIAVLPDFLVDTHIASGALVQILKEYKGPDLGLYIVRPPSDHPPRKIKVLTEILLEKFG